MERQSETGMKGKGKREEDGEGRGGEGRGRLGEVGWHVPLIPALGKEGQVDRLRHWSLPDLQG